MANNSTAPVTDKVTLPFEVTWIRKDLLVWIMPDLDGECYLGTDFVRLFNTILRPRENVFEMDGVDNPIPLEVAAIDMLEIGALAAVGLADLTPDELQTLDEFLERMLPPESDKLGCTDLVEFEINVKTDQPIKQRYYTVSPRLRKKCTDKWQCCLLKT